MAQALETAIINTVSETGSVRAIYVARAGPCLESWFASGPGLVSPQALKTFRNGTFEVKVLKTFRNGTFEVKVTSRDVYVKLK